MAVGETHRVLCAIQQRLRQAEAEAAAVLRDRSGSARPPGLARPVADEPTDPEKLPPGFGDPPTPIERLVVSIGQALLPPLYRDRWAQSVRPDGTVDWKHFFGIGTVNIAAPDWAEPLFMFGLSIVPVAGDGIDLVTQLGNHLSGKPVDGLVVGLSVIGLVSDISTLYVGPDPGDAVNVGAAGLKTLVRDIPPGPLRDEITKILTAVAKNPTAIQRVGGVMAQIGLDPNAWAVLKRYPDVVPGLLRSTPETAKILLQGGEPVFRELASSPLAQEGLNASVVAIRSMDRQDRVDASLLVLTELSQDPATLRHTLEVIAQNGNAAGANFANAERLADHYFGHVAEFGHVDVEAYLDGARTLIQGGPGIQTLVRPKHGTLFYNPVTNEFASVSTRGVIRTYYQPDDGLQYWLGQIR